MRRVVKGDVPSLRGVAPDVPEELQKICERALHPARDTRYARKRGRFQIFDS